MKYQLSLYALMICFFVNAQTVVDDFETGVLESTLITTSEPSNYFQKGNTIIGQARHIKIHLDKNPFGQSFQITIRDGLLAVTAPYDTRGTFSLAYGKISKNKAAPLKLDVGTHTHLYIRFAAKSTINGFYAMLYSVNSRAVFGKQLPAKEGAFEFAVPLSDFKKIGTDFRLSQIDGIRFQFDSRSKTGCSMAIDGIWFE